MVQCSIYDRECDKPVTSTLIIVHGDDDKGRIRGAKPYRTLEIK